MDKNQEIQREFKVEGLQLRTNSDGTKSRTIEGYAILFNSPSVNMYEDEREVIREIIAPSAVSRELLDNSDIVMTMFHDNKIILARSKNGDGTLSYDIDKRGVSFSFEAPNTIDGDKAVELVSRGDIDGCSFAFRTRYWDEDYVTCRSETIDGKIVSTYEIRKIKSLHDFTLTPSPAYPETECSCRELVKMLREKSVKDDVEETERRELVKKQVEEMRKAMKF